jgi:hypothetical protein
MDRAREANAAVSSSVASTSTQRKVLGDVSPNLKHVVKSGFFDRKAMAGSPLKRTVSAMYDDSGFTYLKKRKLSADKALSSMGVGAAPSPPEPKSVPQNAIPLTSVSTELVRLDPNAELPNVLTIS